MGVLCRMRRALRKLLRFEDGLLKSSHIAKQCLLGPAASFLKSGRCQKILFLIACLRPFQGITKGEDRECTGILLIAFENRAVLRKLNFTGRELAQFPGAKRFSLGDVAFIYTFPKQHSP